MSQNLKIAVSVVLALVVLFFVLLTTYFAFTPKVNMPIFLLSLLLLVLSVMGLYLFDKHFVRGGVKQ